MSEGLPVEAQSSWRRDPWLWASLVLFLGVRAAAMTRAPDIDELFTAWIIQKPIPDMMETLRLDSGPPLHYLLLWPFHSLSPIFAARLVSLFAGVALLLVATWAIRDRTARRLIAFLIALHPLHVFFSTRGRAYSLVALMILVAAVALVQWADSRDRRMLLAGSLGLTVAAYTHYYAIYLFPLPLLIALTRDRKMIRDGALACAGVGLAFIPGFLLLWSQPAGALAWMKIEDDVLRVIHTLGSFGRLGFDGRQRLPFEPATMALQLVGPLLLLIALAGTRRSARAARYLVVVLTAIAGAVAAAALGFSAYFPLRFESVLIGPVVLFYALSIRELRPSIFRVLAVVAIVVAAVATSTVAFGERGARSPERSVAEAIRDHASPEIPIYTTGPIYFELRAQRNETWSPPLNVFPRELEVHPGHRGTERMILEDLKRLKEKRERFLWVGPSSSFEAKMIRDRMDARVVDDRYGLTTLLVDPGSPAGS